MCKKNKQKSINKNAYSFGKFLKRHILILIILCIIPIVACAIFIPLLCFKEFNVWDLGSFLGGLLAYIGTALLGAVSMWQNEKLKIENDLLLEKQAKQAEKDKEILLEQNRTIASNSARFAVMPILSVNMVQYSISQKLFEHPKPLTQTEKRYRYFEDESWYFAVIIVESEIKLQKDEPIEIKNYKNNLLDKRKDSNGVTVLCAKKDVYAPLIIKNIGLQTALQFSFAVYKDNHIDVNFRKYIIARNFGLQDELRIDFYFPSKGSKCKYWLEFTYCDILGNEYLQKSFFTDDEDGIKLDLSFKQILQDQNNK